MSTEAFYDKQFDGSDWKGLLATGGTPDDHPQAAGDWMADRADNPVPQRAADEERPADGEARRAKAATALLRRRHGETSATGSLIHWTRRL